LDSAAALKTYNAGSDLIFMQPRRIGLRARWILVRHRPVVDGERGGLLLDLLLVMIGMWPPSAPPAAWRYGWSVARDRRELLMRETPDFILRSLWPSNSPDLNPVDYTEWDVLQERVCREKIRTV